MNRRSFITGLCAPLIVPAASLDYVPRGLVMPRKFIWLIDMGESDTVRLCDQFYVNGDARAPVNFNDGGASWTAYRFDSGQPVRDWWNATRIVTCDPRHGAVDMRG